GIYPGGKANAAACGRDRPCAHRDIRFLRCALPARIAVGNDRYLRHCRRPPAAEIPARQPNKLGTEGLEFTHGAEVCPNTFSYLPDLHTRPAAVSMDRPGVFA